MKTIFYSHIAIKKITFLFFVVALAIATNAQTYRIFDPPSGGPPLGGPSGGAAGVDANRDAPGGLGALAGLKFRVVQGGTIDALHFFKGTANVSANILSLWTVSGTNLATVTLPADAISGWRTVPIPPVVVASGTTYVVSVFNATGAFAGSSGGLPTTDFTGRPGFIIIGGVTSAADPANQGNGVLEVTNSSATVPVAVEPGAYNFWVDVQFTTFFPLPARLSDFNAATSNRNVVLTWKTESEQNNKGFEIQRSNNGSDWYPVGFVNGAGESSTTKSYSYTDRSLAPGHYYYRLEQKDFDGKSAKSSVVTATIAGRASILLSTGINPVITSTNIRFDLPEKQKVRLSLFDMNGREIKVLADNVRESGSHQVILSAAGLQRQTYIIRLQTETETLTNKIIIQ